MAQRGSIAEIDLGELEKLAAMQATDEEIAAWFGVTTRTIERRRKNPRFAEIMTRGKAKGRLNMRRTQLRLLEQGNATMAIWLGKQYLGQRDEVAWDFRASGVPMLSLVLPRASDTAAIQGLASGEPKALEIGPADYEKVTEDE